MEVKYKLKEENIKKSILDFLAVVVQKEKLKKNPNKRMKSLLEFIIINLGLLDIMFLMIVFFNNPDENKYYLAIGILMFNVLIMCIYFGIKKATVDNFKKGKNTGTLIIDENGIRDINDLGIEVFNTWGNFDFCVITENIILIMFEKTDICIFINYTKANEKKIKNSLNEYIEDPLIIKK